MVTLVAPIEGCRQDFARNSTLRPTSARQEIPRFHVQAGPPATGSHCQKCLHGDHRRLKINPGDRVKKGEECPEAYISRPIESVQCRDQNQQRRTCPWRFYRRRRPTRPQKSRFRALHTPKPSASHNARRTRRTRRKTEKTKQEESKNTRDEKSRKYLPNVRLNSTLPANLAGVYVYVYGTAAWLKGSWGKDDISRSICRSEGRLLLQSSFARLATGDRVRGCGGGSTADVLTRGQDVI